ncbi:Galactose/methyl galactoside import ATP-binding protein MglA [Pantoea agglomerans]|uniref:Ribose/galactose/methyl galactoside import ATP-binding protein n=1 Tax=Enterobacter agglomerans TaxID=549 RepID=A0A379ADG4_ENTAG|nr:Galactose/methyl galactoside import ATP-binding protein MglA [Pantoea agglomerans]
MGGERCREIYLIKMPVLVFIKKIPAVSCFRVKRSDYKSSKEALENGVSMVHQELNLVLQRTVMDNMWLGRYPRKGFFVDQDKMYRGYQSDFLTSWILISIRAIKLPIFLVSQMQMIEIAKAFSYDAKNCDYG